MGQDLGQLWFTNPNIGMSCIVRCGISHFFWYCLICSDICIEPFSPHIIIVETTCPNDMSYKPCASSAQKTCLTLEGEQVTETGVCVEGCFCPDDLILEGDKCIRPEQCGCFYDNGYLAVSRWYFYIGPSQHTMHWWVISQMPNQCTIRLSLILNVCIRLKSYYHVIKSVC